MYLGNSIFKINIKYSLETLFIFQKNKTPLPNQHHESQYDGHMTTLLYGTRAQPYREKDRSLRDRTFLVLELLQSNQKQKTLAPVVMKSDSEEFK